ncbi:MAG TPA: response regulator transcription factor [Candidatus Sulfotelmatobacter sp.]|nr:response regulator transcription factor [Candidatus Sulfotelmatobacter sp.]
MLADDHPLVRAGIRAELEKLPRAKVVAEAGDGRETLKMVKAHQPDVVFIDISMPGLNGLEALSRITREFPDVRVVVLSMHDNEEYVWRALKAGAAGYLLKRAATTELQAALEQVMSGKIYLSRDIAAQSAKQIPSSGNIPRRNPLEGLTGRQREILQLIGEGRNTKEIAQILKVSPKTIEYHRMQLMNRLDVHDIPNLVRLALKNGLVAEEY